MTGAYLIEEVCERLINYFFGLGDESSIEIEINGELLIR